MSPEWITASGIVGAALVTGFGTLFYKRRKNNGNPNNSRLLPPIVPVSRDLCDQRYASIQAALGEIKTAVKPIPVMAAWIEDQKRLEEIYHGTGKHK